MKIGKLGISQRRALWELCLEDEIAVRDLNHRTCLRYGRRIPWGATGATLPSLAERGLVTVTESEGFWTEAIVRLGEALDESQRASFRQEAIEVAAAHRADLVQEARTAATAIEAARTLMSGDLERLARSPHPGGLTAPEAHGERLAHAEAASKALCTLSAAINTIEIIDRLPAAAEVVARQLALGEADPLDPSF